MKGKFPVGKLPVGKLPLWKTPSGKIPSDFSKLISYENMWSNKNIALKLYQYKTIVMKNSNHIIFIHVLKY